MRSRRWSLASQWAPELRLGTAIAGIYTRAPVALAVSAGTLGMLAPGRFVLGLGTSSQVAVEQWNGIPFEKPLQRSRDMLRFLRAALTGEKVTQQYETFSVNGFRLDPAPEVPPALALAALRPGMIKVAVRESDAVITNWLAPKDVPQVRSVAGEDVEVIARVFVCPTTDTDVARAIGRRVVAAYLTVPVYAAFHEWLGRGELLAPMLKAWAAGDRRGALEVLPDEVVDDLIIHGPLEYCRERVASTTRPAWTPRSSSCCPRPAPTWPRRCASWRRHDGRAGGRARPGPGPDRRADRRDRGGRPVEPADPVPRLDRRARW